MKSTNLGIDWLEFLLNQIATKGAKRGKGRRVCSWLSLLQEHLGASFIPGATRPQGEMGLLILTCAQRNQTKGTALAIKYCKQSCECASCALILGPSAEYCEIMSSDCSACFTICPKPQTRNPQNGSLPWLDPSSYRIPNR